MKINSVSERYTLNSANLSVQNSGLKTTKALKSPYSKINSLNFLADKNHNGVFVKTNQISFGESLPPSKIEKNPLEDKISAALRFIGVNDVVLAGRDLNSAKEDFEDALPNIDKLISRVIFVPDENVGGSFYITTNAQNVPYISNLTDKPIFQISDDKIYRMDKKSQMFLHQGGLFKTEINGRPFAIKENKNATDEDLSNFGIQIHDFSQTDNDKIQELNKKRIRMLGRCENETKPQKKITFADVGGQDEAIRDLKESVIYPIRYSGAFSVVNHGIILEGGPGTGKTLLAQALANEADANFIKLNGLEMESKWVGESEENWRILFDDAKENQPSIIFIDEFDAVAKNREGSDSSRHDDKVVNQLLTIMSDIEKDGDEVYVIAATNKKDLLDKAILRSGRFGKHIKVLNPDLQGCEKILSIYTKDKKLGSDFNPKVFAKRLKDADVSGADIAAIAEDARNFAYKRENIFEKMESGTFNLKDVKNLELTGMDFDLALNAFKKNNEKAQKRIGFVWGTET